jgi:hypothetical protein
VGVWTHQARWNWRMHAKSEGPHSVGNRSPPSSPEWPRAARRVDRIVGHKCQGRLGTGQNRRNDAQEAVAAIGGGQAWRKLGSSPSRQFNLRLGGIANGWTKAGCFIGGLKAPHAGAGPILFAATSRRKGWGLSARPAAERVESRKSKVDQKNGAIDGARGRHGR